MKKIKTILCSIITGLAIILINPSGTLAQSLPFQKPYISFTFDDGYASTYLYALPILQKYNLTATTYIITSLIGQPGYLTWEQVQELQDKYGWEIGSHTEKHRELPKLSLTEIRNEIINSKNTLAQHGVNAYSFASPYGAYNNVVLAEILKVYGLHRGFWDRDDLNSWPYNRAIIMVQSVETNTSFEQVKSWVDKAITENKWLVLVFHEILPVLNPDYPYVNKIEELDTIARYISQSRAEVINPKYASKDVGENLISNFTFDNGLDDWTIDNQNKILLDTNNNGSYPSAINSIKFSGITKKNIHIFSKNISVNPNSEYLFEVFVNTNNLTNGEIGYYVDEYDSSDNWISGKWLGSTNRKVVTFFSKIYKPSSEKVRKIKIQTYIANNSNGKAYLDNYKFINLTPDVPYPPEPTQTPIFTPEASTNPMPTFTPTPTVIATIPPSPPTPTPQTTNLISNGEFNLLDEDGWATNWIRQTADFSISGGMIKLEGQSKTHLFSEIVNIEAQKKYRWSSYIDALSVGSEFGFYIDEYDESGKWISGQWKGMINKNSTGNLDFSYTPSSSKVSKIRLQYYYTGGEYSLIYIDSVILTYEQ